MTKNTGDSYSGDVKVPPQVKLVCINRNSYKKKKTIPTVKATIRDPECRWQLASLWEVLPETENYV